MSRARKRRRLGTGLLGLGGLSPGTPGSGTGQRAVRTRGGGRLKRALRSPAADKIGVPPHVTRTAKGNATKKKASSRVTARDELSEGAAAKRPKSRSKISAEIVAQLSTKKGGARTKVAARSKQSSRTPRK